MMDSTSATKSQLHGLLATSDEDQRKLDLLPFLVFLRIAKADSTVSVREVQTFLRLLERQVWCRSTYARLRFPETRRLYSKFWHEYGERGEEDYGLFRSCLVALRRHCPTDELDLAYQDLNQLARSVALADGGFAGIGAISRRERTALEILGALSRETLWSFSGEHRLPVEPSTVPVWNGGTIQARCVHIVHETHDVKTFRFSAEPARHFVYEPGQFITLEVVINGKKVRRSYTISSSPSRTGTMDVTVKRVPGGLVSNWLHDHLDIGSMLTLTGPSGTFTCTSAHKRKLLLISAGSGITPMLSMSRWFYDRGDDRDIVFLHSARTAYDIPCWQELSLIAGRHPSFQVIYTLTGEVHEDWEGLQGRLDRPMLTQVVPDFRDRTVYLCGPNPFMEAVKEVLEGSGFPMEHYHAESFGGRSPKPPAKVRAGDSANDERAKLTFLESGQCAPCSADDTILDIAEALGIDIPTSCRSGACGSCKVLVKKGTVDMENDEGLSDGDREQGYVLSCVGRPMGQVSIVA